MLLGRFHRHPKLVFYTLIGHCLRLRCTLLVFLNVSGEKWEFPSLQSSKLYFSTLTGLHYWILPGNIVFRLATQSTETQRSGQWCSHLIWATEQPNRSWYLPLPLSDFKALHTPSSRGSFITLLTVKGLGLEHPSSSMPSLALLLFWLCSPCSVPELRHRLSRYLSAWYNITHKDSQLLRFLKLQYARYHGTIVTATARGGDKRFNGHTSCKNTDRAHTKILMLKSKGVKF